MKISKNVGRKKGKQSVAVTVQDRGLNWSKSISIQGIDGQSLYKRLEIFLKEMIGDLA